MNPIEIKEKIDSNEYKICNKRGRSKIWDCFGCIKDDMDIEIPNFVACKTCKNVYIFNKKCQSNLSKHKCCQLIKIDRKTESVSLDQESDKSSTRVFKSEFIALDQESEKSCTEVFESEFDTLDQESEKSFTDVIKSEPITLDQEKNDSEDEFITLDQESEKSCSKVLEIKNRILSTEFKICKKRGRSMIWNCFGLIKDSNGIDIPDFVACRMCKNVFKYNKNGQSNLNRHKCFQLIKNDSESEFNTLEQEKNDSENEFFTLDQESNEPCTNVFEIKDNILSNKYKIGDKRGRSKIWNCFGFIKDNNNVEIPDFVVCKMCKNVYKFKKDRQSNLNKHKCFQLIKNDSGSDQEKNDSENEFITLEQEDEKSCTNVFEIKNKILSNEYKICDKKGRSKIWDCFGFIKDNNDIEIANFVACKICKNVYKFNKNGQSNLNKHKCFQLIKNDIESDQEKTDSEDEFISLVPESNKSCTNVFEIKDNIILNQYKICDKKGQSNIWHCFGFIKDHNDVEIPDFVACKMCKSVYKYDKYDEKCQSNLNKHKCFELMKNNIESDSITLDQEKSDSENEFITSDQEKSDSEIEFITSDQEKNDSENEFITLDEESLQSGSDVFKIKDKILSNEYKICKKRGRSKIWNFFGFIKDNNGVEIPDYVACRMCKNVYKYNKNGQSNLNRHKCCQLLKDDSESEFITLDKESKKSCPNAFEIKNHILSTEYKICDKIGRSKIWDCFGLIKDNNGVDVPDVVACKMCKNVYKYDKICQSNLNKHKCFQLIKNDCEGELVTLDQESKKSCNDVLTEWIIKSARPYSLLQDDGLRRYSQLMLSFGKKFGTNIDLESSIPHPTAIEENVKNSFSINFEKLKSEIACVKKIGYALTCDLWTENYSKITYLALTAHYIMDSQCKSKLLGVKSMKGITNTSFNIKHKLDTLLSDFNCSFNDPTVIVTGEGSNIRAALNDYDNMNCIIHLIYNTVEKCIKSSLIISEIVATSSNLVKFLKKSGLNYSLNTPLKSFTSTGWSTTYFTLLSIKSNFADIQNTITEQKLADKYSVIKEYYLDQVIAILKPFIEASNELEGSSYATIHLVHPHIRKLKAICNSTQSDEPNFITDFKKNLHDTLISLVDSHINIYHKLAIFLFPPANQLKEFNLDERTEITNKCQSLLLPYLNDLNIVDSPAEDNPSKIYSLFQNYIDPIERNTSKESAIENEMTNYKNTQVPLHSDFNVLKWWHERRNEFPMLYKLSCRIFSIPASSAPSERVFAIARSLITDKRSKLVANEKSFNDILFVKFNSED